MEGVTLITPNTTPIVSPLSALFRSRKFVLTFVGVILDLVIVLLPLEVAPRIAAMRGELVTAITVLIGVAVGGIAVEDAAEKHATPPTLIGISGEPLGSETEQTLKPQGGDWQS